MNNQKFKLGKKIYDIKNLWKGKKYRIEIVVLLLMIIMTILGIVLDILTSNGIICFKICKINSFSSTLLQIQSTIATLTIALVALISGNIGKSYMGVSICDFNLNIRPAIFKQKRIVLSSIVLLAISVVFHLYNLYNLVFSLFGITIMLIILSICEVYEAFKGKGCIENEIKEYIIGILNGRNDYSKKNDIFQNYINDWKESCLFQSQLEYENYLKIFNLGMNSLLNNKSNESIKDVEKSCSEMAYCLLCADRSKVVERGITFVQNTYDQMAAFTREKNAKQIHYTVGFNMFGEILSSFEKAIESLPLSTVEQSLHLDELLYDIANVCYLLHCNNESKDNRWFPELQDTFQFCRDIGRCLSRQVRLGNTPNTQYWGNIIKDANLSSVYGIPEKFNDNYLKFKCQLCFYYCYGLICNHFFSIIKESAFYYSMPNYLRIENKYQVMCHLSLACLLYYLAQKEDELCIPSELKKDAEAFIEDTGVKIKSNSFIYALSEHHEFLNVEIEQELYNILRPLEFFPRYSNCKTMIMKNVTEEFYVFLIMYIGSEYYGPDLFSFAFGNNYETIVRYQNDFLGAHKSNTKSNLMRFYSLIDVKSKNKDDLQRKIDSMYERFEQYITFTYKQLAMEQAIQYQEKYESENFEDKYIKNLNEKIKLHLTEKFSPIIAKNEFSIQVTFRTLPQTILTEDCIDKNVGTDMDFIYSIIIDAKFFQCICKLLTKKDFVILKQGKDFVHTSDLAEYFDKQKVKMLIGTEGYLKYNDYFQKYNCIYIQSPTDVLALKENSLKINIKRVNTTIHSLTFEEANPAYNESINQYIYEIRDGVSVAFTKDELESFLHDDKKVVDISIELSYDIQDNAGIIIKE